MGRRRATRFSLATTLRGRGARCIWRICLCGRSFAARVLANSCWWRWRARLSKTAATEYTGKCSTGTGGRLSCTRLWGSWRRVDRENEEGQSGCGAGAIVCGPGGVGCVAREELSPKRWLVVATGEERVGHAVRDAWGSAGGGSDLRMD